MENVSHPAGKIITFYSFKGGTGRSMAAANIACLLAGMLSNSTRRILIVDWDLEAPGLHRYFAAQAEKPENIFRPGILDYFRELQRKLEDDERLHGKLTKPGGWETLEKVLPLDDYLVRDVVAGVDLIKAGRLDPKYPESVSTFNWMEFYRRYGAVIGTFRKLLEAKYAYSLIDSRTGFTDISGICTMLMPEKLVAVFIPNRQNLIGCLDLAERVTEHRRASVDFRPLSIFPLPSRIENAEADLKREWRDKYEREFEKKFREVYELQDCALADYFNEVLLPYHPYYSYGEKIAVLEESRRDSLSLSGAYERFFRRLIGLDFAWDTSEEGAQDAVAAEVFAAEPFEKKYDVFHDMEIADREFVGPLAVMVEDFGVKQFYPIQDVIPGDEWDAALEEARRSSATVAVYIGRDGVSVRRDRVLRALCELVGRNPNRRIIPVLIPGGDPSQIPHYLRRVNWVDFRGGLQDETAFRRLLSGIAGKRVEELTAAAPGQSGARYGETSSPVLLPRDVHFSMVSQAVTDGRIVVFLGPGVNQPKLPTTKWSPGTTTHPPTDSNIASHLARSFSFVGAEGRDLAHVAQLVSLMHGTGPLYETLHTLFEHQYEPRTVHRLLAALPSYLGVKGQSLRHMLIVTTNYDDALERAFAEAGEPYDLVWYASQGREQGKFVHRFEDGRESVIERPNEYRGLSFEKRTVILKTHGGVDRNHADRDRFMITEDDYVNYLVHVDPSRIPVTLLAKLRRSNLLFLGYSLREWTLRGTVHRILDGQKLNYTSWAIQWNPNQLDQRFWSQRDVEVLNMQLDDYTDILWERIKASTSPDLTS